MVVLMEYDRRGKNLESCPVHLESVVVIVNLQDSSMKLIELVKQKNEAFGFVGREGAQK